MQLSHAPHPSAHGTADEQTGASLFIMIVGLTALLVVSAFAIDLGFARQQARHVQGNVDVAALAAAQDLPFGPDSPDYAVDLASARDRAMQMMAHNQKASGSYAAPSACGSSPTCTRTVGPAEIEVQAPYPLYGASTAHRYVRVHACVDTPGFFGGIAGHEDQQVCRSAVARRVARRATHGTGLMALERQACKAMEFTGNSETDLVIGGNSGAIIVNSSCEDQALYAQGNPVVEAGEVLVVGGAHIQKPERFSPAPTEVPEPFPDPFADLVEPPRPAARGQCRHGVCTPGYYSNGLRIMNGTYTWEPGIYWIDGGIRVRGGSHSVTDPGVMLFVNSGEIDLNGNARLDLPPPDTGPYEGISIFQSRSNTNGAKINGNSGSSIGTVYLPSAPVELLGTAGPGDGPFVTGSVVAKTVSVSGNGVLSIFVPDDAPKVALEPDLGLER